MLFAISGVTESLTRQKRALLALLLVLVISSESYAQSTTSGQSIQAGNSIENVATFGAASPVVITNALPNASQNSLYPSQTLSASGGITCGANPYVWAVSSGSLPTGLNLSTAGLISGTATVVGIFSFSVTATDCSSPGLTSAPQSLSIQVVAPPSLPTVQTTSLPGGQAGVPYSAPTLSASGGALCSPTPYVWALASGSLPLGIVMSNAGVFAGTSATPGTYNFAVTATDCAASPATSAPKSLTIVIAAAPTPPVVQTSSVPGATLNVGYPAQTLAATGGTSCGATPYVWAIASGSLPPNMALSPAGVVSGSPTSTGAFAFSVTARDCGSPFLTSAPKSFSLVVSATAANLKDENLNCTTSSCNFGPNDGSAQAPQAGIYTGTDGTPAPGAVINVVTAADLTNALASVQCGQVISIAVGTLQSSTGWTLPNLACDNAHWIWIVSAAAGAAGFPPEHTRATPCYINQATTPNYPPYPCPNPAMLMPTLQVTTANKAVFTTAAGGNHYRTIGLNLQQANGVPNNLNLFNAGGGGSHHIILDRMLIHGQPLNCTRSGNQYTCGANALNHGVGFSTSNTEALINSWVWDVYCTQTSCPADSAAVSLGGNSGTFDESTKKLYGNMISGSGETYFNGGGGAGTSTLTPCDFEIRGNHFFKPAHFQLYTSPAPGVVSLEKPILKNDGELKNACRVLVEGNVYENSWETWQGDQKGYAALITPKNQSAQGPAGTATSDGAGNLTATAGSFPIATAFDPNCPFPAPGGTGQACEVKYAGIMYLFSSCADSTHCAVINGANVPPAGSASFIPCLVGLNPNATVHDVIFRWNEFRNVKKGISIATARSDCGDISAGAYGITARNNLFHGIAAPNSNGFSPDSGAACFSKNNSQDAPKHLHDVTIDHNTCIISNGKQFAFAGTDTSLDATNNTTNGSDGAYMSNQITTNNVGQAGGQGLYKAGALYPGGLLANLKQQSCTPAVTGTTCTYTYSKNINGIAQWSKQTVAKPFPVTNADPTDSPAGTGCTASGATCFPSGTAFPTLFRSYNYAGVQPAGTYDMLDWMVPSDRTTKHLIGGLVPRWFVLDSTYIWWMKSSTGWAADVQVYDDQFIYNLFTENGDPSDQAACGGSCYNLSSAWKMSLSPHAAIPRYFTPGTHVIIMIPPVLTAGNVNPYLRTTNCGTDNQTIKFLGNVKFDTFGPSTTRNWGGDVGNAPVIENDYFYSGNVSGVYQNLEKRFFSIGFGWFGWEYWTLVSGTFQIQQSSYNVTKVAGGAPPINFSCGLPFYPPAGIPGYKGNYNLASGSTYAGAGTDGKDLGVDMTLLGQYLNGPTGTNPTASDTVYTPAVITTADPLPNATHGVAITPLQLTATSAGDMQVWTQSDISFSQNTWAKLPAGMSLSLAGVLSGTPTTAGVYVFTLQMQDAAQQIARKTFTLTVL